MWSPSTLVSVTVKVAGMSSMNISSHSHSASHPSMCCLVTNFVLLTGIVGMSSPSTLISMKVKVHLVDSCLKHVHLLNQQNECFQISSWYPQHIWMRRCILCIQEFNSHVSCFLAPEKFAPAAIVISVRECWRFTSVEHCRDVTIDTQHPGCHSGLLQQRLCPGAKITCGQLFRGDGCQQPKGILHVQAILAVQTVLKSKSICCNSHGFLFSPS